MSASGRVGSVVAGKYRLVRLLGEGGMGEVYEAQHAIIGRRFAIKFLHAHLTRNPEVVARFQREAQAAGALENENIAAALDFGAADDGAPFLVMEFLEGEDLARLLARVGTLPVPRAVSIVIQACRGLLAAHDRQIVHRDLKPENLFICQRNDRSDLVKVLDFGIAKLCDMGAVTQSGATMGTPSYMSMEQARGARDVDQRTDIYALGVILYETLGGAKPHPGSSCNEIIYHIITEPPRPLATLRPLPPGLCAVVERAMAREACARFASVVDLAEALAPFAGGPIAPLRPETAPRSATCPLPPEACGPAPVWGGTARLPAAGDETPLSKGTVRLPTTNEAASRGRRAGLWVALLVGVCGVGAGAAWLLRSPASSRGRELPAVAPASRPTTEASPSPDAAPARAADPAARDQDARPSGKLGSPDGGERPARVPAHARSDDSPARPASQRKNTRPFDRANPYDD